MLRNGCCAWDPARVVRASSHVCHVHVPRPRSPLNTQKRGQYRRRPAVALNTQKRGQCPAVVATATTAVLMLASLTAAEEH
eukprot:7326100-Prymnesium_polylepis.1